MPRPDLLALGLDELAARARAIRDDATGSVVTYSPKVFIPLTMLCRDKCGYCTFAQPPARLDSPYLSPDEVLAIARRGAEMGCHEALFTLGERPEKRYPVATDWLQRHGYSSTVDYVIAMARLVLDETGLLPHANTGAMYADELARLRAVSPSQGMMVETLRDDLDCHRGAPDKVPQRRLDTLEWAGEQKIPYTTGILVGIGEDREDRVAALEAIAAAHERHGHVQEVIVQNFLPKDGTAMHNAPPCPRPDHLEAIALARIILPPEVAVQAPPNLSDDFGDLLDAGVSDWGGVSPVTADHVNPERPWPDLDRLREVTEAKGLTLAPRLTVHPRYACDPDTWIDEALHFPVMDRSDSDGFARDDPGSVWPERTMERSKVDDGAEFDLVGDLSTQWYVGAGGDPQVLVPGRAGAGGAVGEVLQGVRDGQDVGFDEILALFRARGPEVAAVAEVADDLRRDIVGDDVTWVANRNINYTNVCTFKCRFCGFSKGPLSLNLRGTPYLLTLDDIADRTIEAAALGATEVCLQGGIHPDFDGEYYIDVAKAVHAAVPDIHIHGFTALEVTEGAKRNDEPLADYLTRLKDAGQRSLPGTAAEILHDEVRETLCPDKIDTEEWLEAHRVAHSVGLGSNVTIMFGSMERPEHWVHHILRTRALQEETGGFTEFVGLPFVHMASPIYLRKMARRGPTWREVLLMHAVARIAYRGRIDNIQGSWVKLGFGSIAQLLQSGANDLGGTLIDENISRAAGADHGTGVTPEDFRAVVEPLGRRLVQRTTLYGRPDLDALPLTTTRRVRTVIPVAGA
ncbi:MAG: 5-amino-6-(D-ribitylamino)uracil--L-tyrosine 4-hydroxyphenyl transferase CofH [Acidimicrobiales bacterium]|nr:5-amino-6-(D-ribitylamino)uracil--L-tyrosine 4-hydroxyphenyl transferase CofH [Acidimicrobiales bacterium]